MILNLKLLAKELALRACLAAVLPVILGLACAGVILLGMYAVTALLLPGYSLSKFVRGVL